MPFDQYLRHDEGSSIVGFVLIIPVLIGAFFAVLQIANLVNVKSTMVAAANSGARVASTYDSSLSDGVRETEERLSNLGISSVNLIKIDRKLIDGLTMIEVEIEKNYEIPWIGYNLRLRAVGLSVDEKSL